MGSVLHPAQVVLALGKSLGRANTYVPGIRIQVQDACVFGLGVSWGGGSTAGSIFIGTYVGFVVHCEQVCVIDVVHFSSEEVFVYFRQETQESKC